MKKNNNKTNVLNTNTGVQHVQIAGVAYYDESKYFMFAPDFIGKNRVPSLRMRGVAQQMSDGTLVSTNLINAYVNSIVNGKRTFDNRDIGEPVNSNE